MLILPYLSLTLSKDVPEQYLYSLHMQSHSVSRTCFRYIVLSRITVQHFLTSGLVHPYHWDESIPVLGIGRCFHFLLHFP